MYKKLYIVKYTSSVGREDEESDNDFEQRSGVDIASKNNDEVIPDADEVESDTDIGQFFNPSQFEQETSGKYFKEL